MNAQTLLKNGVRNLKMITKQNRDYINLGVWGLGFGVWGLGLPTWITGSLPASCSWMYCLRSYRLQWYTYPAGRMR